MKDTIRYGLVLFLICLISTALLSFVYSLTQQRILNQKMLQQRQAMKEVLPLAETIEEAKSLDSSYYIGYDKNKQKLGYAFIVETKGYAGIITICVAVTPEGRILAVKILSHSETPGLGAKITEESFLSKFKNRKLSDIGTQDAITGATISSTAVINSIKDRVTELLSGIN